MIEPCAASERLNWTKVGLKVVRSMLGIPKSCSLNWTKVGLKGHIQDPGLRGRGSLNWTKVGLKVSWTGDTHPTRSPFELD